MSGEIDTNALGQRLKSAREARGFKRAVDAARRYGWSEATYYQHENGTRAPGREKAREYAQKLKVSIDWLLNGVGERDLTQISAVPIVGFVGAGAALNIFEEGQGPFDEVQAPPGASSNTVAVEVRGGSMPGVAEDGWLVYYDERREPLTDDLLGQLCVLGLTDGRVVIKKPFRGSAPGLFHLHSAIGDPLVDIAVQWAAKVDWIKPR